MASKKTPIDQRVRARIKELRVARGLTQEALSERAEMSVDAINRIEHASRTPTLETVEKIARALDVTVADLIDPERAPPPAGLPPPLNQLVALLGTQPAHVQEASLKLAA
jgi:transcriptional regulator with XRE-family HTH domain